MSPSFSELSLVESSPAALSTAKTRDLLILQGEFVVVGDFLIHPDRLLRVDDDLFLGLDRDNFCVAVGLKVDNNNHY